MPMIVLIVASSGIACLFPTIALTCYLRFRIPINVDELSVCPIAIGSDVSQLLKEKKTNYLG